MIEEFLEALLLPCEALGEAHATEICGRFWSELIFVLKVDLSGKNLSFKSSQPCLRQPTGERNYEQWIDDDPRLSHDSRAS